MQIVLRIHFRIGRSIIQLGFGAYYGIKALELGSKYGAGHCVCRIVQLRNGLYVVVYVKEL
jgi:hypothetical protein